MWLTYSPQETPHNSARRSVPPSQGDDGVGGVFLAHHGCDPGPDPDGDVGEADRRGADGASVEVEAVECCTVNAIWARGQHADL